MYFPSRKSVTWITNMLGVPGDETLHIDKRFVGRGLLGHLEWVTHSVGAAVSCGLPIMVKFHVNCVHAPRSVPESTRVIAWLEDVEGSVVEAKTILG
jgi:hypothetical protein